MLDFFGSSTGAFCDGLSRRNFLKIGAFGAGLTILPAPVAGIILGYVHFNESTGALSVVTKDMFTVQADFDLELKKWFASEKDNRPAAATPPAP